MTVNDRDPKPPTNVVLCYGNDRREPAECLYAGVRDGMHVWEVIGPADGYEGLKGVDFDELAPMSVVSVTVHDDVVEQRRRGSGDG